MGVARKDLCEKGDVRFKGMVKGAGVIFVESCAGVALVVCNGEWLRDTGIVEGVVLRGWGEMWEGFLGIPFTSSSTALLVVHLKALPSPYPKEKE
jgi:hypothetical protein